MNQKEISELKHHFRVEKNAIGRIYGCYVGANREVISYIDEPLGMMPPMKCFLTSCAVSAR